MSNEDRVRWDDRYADREVAAVDSVSLPAPFHLFAEMFPTRGHALDIACGRGAAAVWLARRGLRVWGLDVSSVAVSQATTLARMAGVAESCRFEVADLDDGLPAGQPADVVLCSQFRDSRLDEAMIGRLAPGALLAVSALSEVDARPGPFRVERGELQEAFSALAVIAQGEADGRAWLLARQPG